MKIVHVNLGGPDVSIDGIASAVRSLTSSQLERGHDVTAFTDADFRARGMVRGPWTALRLGRRIIDLRPDIVHLHSVYRPAHDALAWVLRRNRIPYVVSPHSGLADGARERQKLMKAAYVALFEQRLLRRAGSVLCLSEVERDDVRRLVPTSRATIVPNPRPEAPTGQTVEPGDYLLTLCRFDVEQKGLDVLVDIARLLPDIRFRVFGEPDVNDPGRAADLIASAPSNISFEPPISGAEKARVLQGARGYIQPSRWEGQSISVIEALSAGVPCFVSPYVARTLGADVSKYVLTLHTDLVAAAAQVRSALDQPNRLIDMAESARSITLVEYAPDAVAGRLENAYRSAVERTGRTA